MKTYNSEFHAKFQFYLISFQLSQQSRYNEELEQEEFRNCIHENCVIHHSFTIEPRANTDFASYNSAQFCENGRLATGYEFLWESYQGKGGGGDDDSAGNGFFIHCSKNPQNSDEHGEWIGETGKFGKEKFSKKCKDGNYLHAIEINSEAEQGSGDDTALTNVRLWCINPIDGKEEQLKESPAWSPGEWTGKVGVFKMFEKLLQIRLETMLSLL